MAKRHNKDNAVKSVARVCKVNVPAKSLQVSKGAIIGIKMWGKIDFLTHYCGWTLASGTITSNSKFQKGVHLGYS